MKESAAAESHVELGLTDSNYRSLAKVVEETKEHVASEAFAESEAIKAVPLLGANTKKPYSKPVVKVYGAVGTITAAIANNSSTPDGGFGGGMTKTH